MSDIVVDSSVVAKWVLLEADSAQAQGLIDRSIAGAGNLIVLDLVFPEVVNAIWKQCRRNEITLAQARSFLTKLARSPVQVEAAAERLAAALEIAVKYDPRRV